MTPMRGAVSDYRFDFLDADNRSVGGAYDTGCANDAAANQLAAKLLSERPSLLAVDVWDGRRFVSRLSRSGN